MTLTPILILLVSAAAAADVEPNMQSCAAIADTAARLACYDALAHQAPAPSTPAPSAPAPASPAPPAAPAAPTPATAPAPATTPEDRFGAERLGQPESAEPPKEVTKIETQLKGKFHGWEPGTLFKLANGQVWKSIGDDTAYYPGIPDGPAVVIRRGFFTGSYWMEIKGAERKVKVRRIH